jgi:hypothetical protein
MERDKRVRWRGAGGEALVIFIFLFFSSSLQAQPTIKGRIVNATGGLPIANSNIFINNSSKGTISDVAGYFQLNEIPAGKHELIISCIGYETKVISFSDDKLPMNLNVELQIKVKELENVTVEPFEEGGWKRWGFVFFQSFIGTSENAEQCRIRNQDSIRFRFYKNSNRLVAYADEPIIIENKALGYIISYQMEDFEINFREGSLFYAGYPLVKDIEKDSGVPERWKRKRLKAYKGSILHFMRSLYSNRLKEEGFDVRRMTRNLNLEKKRIIQMYQSVNKNNRVGHGTPGPQVKFQEPDGYSQDSLNYFHTTLRQPDYTETYGADLLTGDSILERSAGSNPILFFTDYLFITYKNETEEEGFVKSQFPVRRPSYQRSYITLLNDHALEIEVNGSYFDPRDLLSSGYWAWSDKMADYVPFDFDPGN